MASASKTYSHSSHNNVKSSYSKHKTNRKPTTYNSNSPSVHSPNSPLYNYHNQTSPSFSNGAASPPFRGNGSSTSFPSNSNTSTLSPNHATMEKRGKKPPVPKPRTMFPVNNADGVPYQEVPKHCHSRLVLFLILL